MKIYKLFFILLIITNYFSVNNIYASKVQTKSRLIENKKPLYGELKLNIREETLIKESEINEAYMFKYIKNIKVDSIGNIYLLDSDRILKYNPKGEYLGIIGRIGQGPGEYIDPWSLFIDNQDNLYILDQGRILIHYAKNGTFKETIRLKSLLLDKFFIDDNGFIYGFIREFSDEGIKKTLAKFDRDGNIVIKIAEFLEKDLRIKSSGTGAGVMSGMRHPLSPDAYFCPILGKQLCFGINLKYELTIYELEGNIQTQFKKKEKAQSISNDIKEYKNRFSKESFKQLYFPQKSPFFKALLSDEKGRIYIIRTKSPFDKDHIHKMDIFDKNGQYLYKTKIPYFPMVIQNGAIFAKVNEEGVRVIKKLIIRNYNDIHY